jgi:hypothetical protein
MRLAGAAMTVSRLASKTPNAVPLCETISLGGQRVIEPEVGGLPGTIY